MLSTPDRSAICPPSAANSNGTPATSPPARSAVSTAPLNSSDIVASPPHGPRPSGRQIARAQIVPAPDILGNRHEDENEPDEHEQEIRWQSSLLRGIFAADGQHRVEGDERDHPQ